MIYCILPVHNRLEHTRSCIEDLVAQDFPEDIQIIVVNDGSTDGTTSYLQQLSLRTANSSRKIVVLEGDGSWWWSKCINQALKLLRQTARKDDGILLLNNDVRLASSYLNELMKCWAANGESVVISQLANIDNTRERIISPIRVDLRQLRIEAAETFDQVVNGYLPSDVAPGRGTLYPARPIIEGLLVDEKHLPHYLADYEFSIRVKNLGWPIFCAPNAHVFTESDWGNSRRRGGFFWYCFSKNSPGYLRAHWHFWRIADPKMSRHRLSLKIFRYKIAPLPVELFGRR